MKAATLRAFLSVHSWMGLLAGMALFIAFYAGAITVFTHALSNWQTTPSATQAAPADPVAAAQTLLDTVIAAHPQVAESFLVLLPGEHGPLARVYWYGPQADASGGMRQYQLSSSGALLELPQRVGFADFLYDLHFTAGLPRTFGTYLFGVVSVLYGLALVSGVVLYAPVFFKDLFALRIGANLKRVWQDAHNVVGMLSLPFHVIFAWSGAVLCLGVLLLAPFQFLVFDGKLLQILEPDFELTPHVAPANRVAPVLPIATLLKKARAASPGFVPESVSYHDAGDANARVEVYGHHDQRQLNTLGGVALEGATGKVLRVLSPRTMRAGTAALRGLQGLHFGNFGHAPLQWLYFLSAWAAPSCSTAATCCGSRHVASAVSLRSRVAPMPWHGSPSASAWAAWPGSRRCSVLHGCCRQVRSAWSITRCSPLAYCGRRCAPLHAACMKCCLPVRR